MPAKKDSESKELKSEAAPEVAPVEEKPAISESTPIPAAAPENVPATESAPEPIMNFDRWFNAQKEKKPHWKAGMKAYANTNGRRTASAWATLFKNY